MILYGFITGQYHLVRLATYFLVHPNWEEYYNQYKSANPTCPTSSQVYRHL